MNDRWTGDPRIASSVGAGDIPALPLPRWYQLQLSWNVLRPKPQLPGPPVTRLPLRNRRIETAFAAEAAVSGTWGEEPTPVVRYLATPVSSGSSGVRTHELP
jgi:hypothetical protein